MPVLRHRLVLAGAAAAAAIAVPVAAFAAAPGSPPGKVAPPAAAPTASKPVPPGNPVPPAEASANAAVKAAVAAAGTPGKPAPIGAFAAIAFTIGKYGLRSVANLATLVACFYLTSALFVAVVLGIVARLNGFRIFNLLRYLRSELFLVLGTSSSEAALPLLMEKLEEAGCDQRVVGLVVPLGYSFNLDGTNIYMTLAALFIAQAFNIDLTAGQIALLLMVAIISSKGAAGVTGAGFITLAATLAVVPAIPVAGLALILGIDRFMSECRSLTNFIGNAVATIVIARWEGALNAGQLRAALEPKEPTRVAQPAI